ncbi:MAG: hydrogenase expression/formation protein HypE [Elusimicrobiales bacterium]|nr:hydrogenase expression/formation protein HypE [Elusimicrobiales bacterium]
MAADRILLAHGGGGGLSRSLVGEVFAAYFENPILRRMDDAAELPVSGRRLAFTTDSFVVDPLFFPGGDIGKIAVCGTVNDLSVKGAVPRWISAAFILEEGLEISLLRRIAASMRAAADEAGVSIVTGDTKVVEKGKADKIFITTSGIGEIPDGTDVSAANVREGDVLIISGPLGAHGAAVMNARHSLGIKSGIESDCAPLNRVAAAVLQCGQVHAMRDLTRGGLAAALNEISAASDCEIELDEALVPVAPDVSAACALLGLDPLYIANEGRLAAFVPAAAAPRALADMRAQRYGESAAIGGLVLSKGKAGVRLKTRAGGLRVLRMPEGEQLPRIC